jgi:hypothetical protein
MAIVTRREECKIARAAARRLRRAQVRACAALAPPLPRPVFFGDSMTAGYVREGDLDNPCHPAAPSIRIMAILGL